MKWLSFLLVPLFVFGCNSGTAETKPESKPEPAKQEAPKPAAKAASGELKGGPYPATEEKLYKVLPSVGEGVTFNGIGWEEGSADGSALLFKGNSLAIESPNSFGDSLRTLTFKVLGYTSTGPDTGVIDTKVDGTDDFGEGALNNFWSSVPFAKVAIKMSRKGKVLQFKFGEPADSIEAAVAPELPDSNPKFKLKR
ncbi:MAG: hypothetical protein D6B27_05580 [Gammaproteobacteria bacterium]|nr:MAG: hypothetical protein D6B27_05580 [Gammaproteobacteria bacterium]